MRWGLFCSVVLSLLACADPNSGSARLDDYLTRLERALKVDRPPPPMLRPPRLSEQRLRPLPIATTAISVLDFLSLSGCALQINIGRRNSALGRNASASQALLLDVEFLHHVPNCVTMLRGRGDEHLAATLESMAEQRKALLPTRIYNALLAGPEFLALWQLPAQLDDYPANVSSDVLVSLDYFSAVIRRWLSGDYSANFANHNTQFEGHLSQLRAGDGGALLLASSTLTRALQQASLLLSNRDAARPLCPQGRVSRGAGIAQTVVAKFFTTNTQPWLASVNARRHSLMSSIASIENLLSPVLPGNYRAWQAQRDTILEATASAPSTHIQAVKAAFKGCASAPWSV